VKKLKLTAVFRSWQTAAIACFLLFTVYSFSDTHYVSLTGGNVSPFTSWANAATNIQLAVDVASSGDIVLVTNGVYDIGGDITPGYSCMNRVVVTNNITVESVNGPGNTIILGKGPNGNLAVRGAYLSSGILSGFTISNGHTRTSGNYHYDNTGGGVNMNGGNGIVTNCLITGNSGGWDGGGTAYGTVNNCAIRGNSAQYGGGTLYGIINNSIISGNSADEDAGGAYKSTVNNSDIIGNSAKARGGGTRAGIVNTCTISENSAGKDGGGTLYSTVNNCIVSENSAGEDGGGTYYGTVNSSAISENSAEEDGGGTYSGIINNCTISGNSADDAGGGTYIGTINNCIVWDNSASTSNNVYKSSIKYSCTYPLPSGMGNISNDPQFISGSDFHLQLTSPCIDAGTNLPYVYTTTDLDGNARNFGGTVDMGCYEFVPEPCLFIIYNLLIVIYYRNRKLETRNLKLEAH